MSSPQYLTVSAVCIFDQAGQLLTVRKRGTSKFMNPGGKPESGETAAQAASRELAEEIGVHIPASELTLLGEWEVDAANEDNTLIRATVYTAPGTWTASAAAEIEELRWMDPAGPWPEDLSPLLLEKILPALTA